MDESRHVWIGHAAYKWFMSPCRRDRRRAPRQVARWLSPSTLRNRLCAPAIHSFVWHDSLIYVMRLIGMCDMTHWVHRHFAILCVHLPCVTWLVHICVTWRIHMCDVPRSCVWHESCMCDVTRSYVRHWVHWHFAIQCVHLPRATWLIHLCDMTCWYVWCAWLIRVTWLTESIDTSQSILCTCHVRHDSLIRDMTRSYVTSVTWLLYMCHDSFIHGTPLAVGAQDEEICIQTITFQTHFWFWSQSPTSCASGTIRLPQNLGGRYLIKNPSIGCVGLGCVSVTSASHTSNRGGRFQ